MIKSKRFNSLVYKDCADIVFHLILAIQKAIPNFKRLKKLVDSKDFAVFGMWENFPNSMHVIKVASAPRMY